MISEEEYKRTLIRIWDSARRYAHRGEPNCEGGECWLCPLEKVCNPAQKPRVELFRVFEAINIVEKWGKEHRTNEAEEVKAIPVERLKDFRNAVMNMNSIAIIQRLDKLIEEVEG